MFKVKHKETGIVSLVYGMTGQYFLVWREEIERWSYVPVNEYEPVEE